MSTAPSERENALAHMQLKNCPFCGSQAVRLDRGRIIEAFAVRCDNCRTVGPLYPAENDAIAAWNKRAAVAVGDGCSAGAEPVSDLPSEREKALEEAEEMANSYAVATPKEMRCEFQHGWDAARAVIAESIHSLRALRSPKE